MLVSSNRFKEKSRNLLQEKDSFYDELEPLVDNEDDEDFLTTSIRVLLVDADPNSSLLMKNIMTQFSYQVTYYENGEDAISFLKKIKYHEIDLVLWDYHMPKINGLEALKTIGKDMDIPVVIMSRDHKMDIVKKSTLFGACDFLVKPVSKEVIAVLWRHVFKKEMISNPDLGNFVGSNLGGIIVQDNDLCQSNEEGSKNVEDNVEHNTSDQLGDKPPAKKRRLSWTAELHQKFEVAVENLTGLDKVYPKHILKYMQEELKVEGLTRNNVASHLQRLRCQKFRLSAEKKAIVPVETQEDSGWRNTVLDTPLPVSKPLLNSNINLQNGLQYYMNNQTAVNAPVQYPMNNYLAINNKPFMNNALANGTYHDPYFQPEQQQQQQQQYYPSLQYPSRISKLQDLGHVSSAMENIDLTSYPDVPFDLHERFPLGYNNLDPSARY